MKIRCSHKYVTRESFPLDMVYDIKIRNAGNVGIVRLLNYCWSDSVRGGSPYTYGYMLDIDIEIINIHDDSIKYYLIDFVGISLNTLFIDVEEIGGQ